MPSTLCTQSDESVFPFIKPPVAETERAKDPKLAEIPPIKFDVAKRYLDQVQPDVTAMSVAMLVDIRANIASGAIDDMTQLDSFVKASKARHPDAWAFRAQGMQQKELIAYVRNDEYFEKEDCLLYKFRQELFEYDVFHNSLRGMLKLYFDKLESGVRKNPAIDKGLAGAIHAEFFKAGCSLGAMSDVEALIMREYELPVPLDLAVDLDISDVKVNSRKAVMWKPTTGADQRLLVQEKYMGNGGFMDFSTDTNPGCWMKLKLRQDFDEFVTSFPTQK